MSLSYSGFFPVFYMSVAYHYILYASSFHLLPENACSSIKNHSKLQLVMFSSRLTQKKEYEPHNSIKVLYSGPYFSTSLTKQEFQYHFCSIKAF